MKPTGTIETIAKPSDPARSAGPLPTQARRGRWLVALFLVLAAGILSAGRFYYQNYEQQFRAQVELQLASIAELKLGELRQYRKERLGDASILFQNGAFSALVQRFLEDPADTDAQRQLQAWLGKYETHYQYDRVSLLDTEGKERMSSPATESPLSQHLADDAALALHSAQVTLLDFHRETPDGPIYLGLLVPLFAGADTNRPLGTLVLRIDPTTYLYPFIHRWPAPSRTAETLLIRREGNDAVFLNELKFQTNAALNRRIPLANEDVPAVRAILGQEGLVEGHDYRNVPVLAYIHAVPDSPWYLVARMDAAEVYAPLRQRLWLTVFLAGLLLFSAAAGTAAIWRQQHVQFYRERAQVAEALCESEERFRRAILESPFPIMLHAEDGAVLQVSNSWCELTGYEREELATTEEWTQHAYGERRHLVQADIDGLYSLNHRKEEGDFHIRTKSGSQRIWDFSSAPLGRLADGRRLVISMAQDVTERREAERALREAEEKFRRTFELMPNPMTLQSTQGVLLEVNDAFCEASGFAREEAIGRTTLDLGLWPDLDQRHIMRETLQHKGRMDDLEIEFRRRNGEMRALLLSARLLPLSPERLVLAVAQDITERKRSEQALRDSEARRTLALEAAKAGTWEWELGSGKNIWSEELWELYGLARHSCEPSYEAWRQTVRPSDRDSVEQALSESIQREVELSLEWRVHDPTGPERWLMSRGKPLRDDSGRVVRYLGIVMDITERKQAEDALKRSRVELLEAQRLARLGNWESNSETGEVTWSDELFRIYGRDPQLGPASLEEVSRYFTPEGWARLCAAKELARTHGAPYTCDAEVVRPNGTRAWIVSQGEPLRNASGKIIGLRGTTQDITERKRAEAAQARLLHILESSLNEIYVFDAESLRFEYVNRAALRNLGYPLETMQTMSPVDLKPEFTEASFREAVVPLLHRELKGLLFNTVHRRADASLYPVEVHLQLVEVQGQRVFLAVILDISERKAAELRLGESEQRFRSLFESMNELAVVHELVCDAAGTAVDYRIIDCNPAFSRVTGIPCAQAAGQLASQVFGAKPAPFLEEYARVVQTGESKVFEVFFAPMDKWFAISAFSPRSGHFATVSLDITERKQHEQERERFLRELARKNEDLEDLLYAASHDLRSPLVNIEGFSQRLDRDCRALSKALDFGSGSDEVRVQATGLLQTQIPKSLHFIRSGVVKMNSLINGLLQLSRLGQASLRLDRLDMNALVQQNLDAMRFQIQKAGASVVTEPLPPCRGDARLVGQVFANLLDNAIKYVNPARALEIRISGKLAGHEAVYCVADTGLGIAPEHQERVWGLFHRLHPDGPVAGEGLGLNLVRRGLDRQQGRAWVESKPGQGCRFFFALPTAEPV